MSPRILAIDCSSEFASLALFGGERVLEEVSIHSPGGFGHLLFDQVERLLARHGVTIGQLDCFAAASGPGSFTGLRIALSAVKGWAEALGKPVVAVSNLQAMATFGSRQRRACFYDARRGEIYAGFYSAALEPLAEEVVCPFSRFAGILSAHPGDWELLAPDFQPFEPALCSQPFTAMARSETPRALAGAVASIAWRRFSQGLVSDPAGVDANYLRRSDAELHWKEDL
jgi:tRNA threonylcarbamoyladenosine biosynthesis protein TsaB